MGTYRRLYADLPCTRCGVPDRTEVQFKTGADHAMPQYELGDLAPDVAPGLYEAIADAHCSACTARWIEDEKRAWCDRLGDQLDDGRLVARHATWHFAAGPRGTERTLVVTAEDGASFTSATLRLLLEEPGGTRQQSFGARLHRARLGLWFEGHCVFPFDGPNPTPAASRWWYAQSDAVDRRLRGEGWPDGEDPTRVVQVRIGADHRVHLAS